MVKINNDELKIIIQTIIDKSKSESVINAQIKQIKTEALKVGLSVDDKEAKKHLKDFHKSVEQETKQIQSALNLDLDKQKLSNNMQNWLNENSRAASAFGERIRELQAELNGVNSKAELTNVTKQFQLAQSEAKALGVTGRTAFDEIANSAQKFFSWFMIGGVISTGVRELRQMITTVQELDKAIVDLQIASGYNRNQVSELIDSYNQLGKRIGATTVEVSQSADSFLRQGYSIEQTNKLIEASMMLSKLGQIDSAEATQYLTSAMKGYKVSVEDVVGVVDKLTKVDMEAAVSAGAIAEAMSRTASGADIAGVSMDKLIGYLTTVGEVTQKSMSSIGESFKTIFARMGNIKIGRFVDDESQESLSDVETVLSHFGIVLRETSGTFRNFGDVLDEVGGKWSTFNDVEKSAISVAFAGKYALCSNM